MNKSNTKFKEIMIYGNMCKQILGLDFLVAAKAAQSLQLSSIHTTCPSELWVPTEQLRI